MLAPGIWQEKKLLEGVPHEGKRYQRRMKDSRKSLTHMADPRSWLSNNVVR